MPAKYTHVWGALGAVVLTTLAAGYAGWSSEWLWSNSLTASLDEADLATSRFLWVCVWCVTRISGCIGACAAWCFISRAKQHVTTLLRFQACFVAAASAALESISFWFDILWLHDVWYNEDVRYGPYAAKGVTIYTLGCFAYATIAFCLLYPMRWSPHLDWVQIKANPALWAGIILASWGASPSLLTLLPWKSNEYAHLPTMCAMDAIYVTKSMFKAALVILKVALVLHLQADEGLIIFTLFLNVLVFARSQLQRLLVLSALRASRTRWTRITIFLSYRVATDQDLVRSLYTKLTDLGLRVWWDVECLEAGKKWEEGFVEGLFEAKVFVPVLSRAGLAPFARLDETSETDNVLLEQVLALEQHARGSILAICPVLVGSRSSSGVHTDFFTEGGVPDTKDVSVQAIDEKAREHLARRYGASGSELHVQDRSPRGVLSSIQKWQGEKLKGDHGIALDNIAHKIYFMVQGVAAGRLSVEARKQNDKGLAYCADVLGQLLVGCFGACALSCMQVAASSMSRLWKARSPEDPTVRLTKQGEVSGFFLPAGDLKEEVAASLDEVDTAAVVNPIIVQKAKWRQEAERAEKQHASPNQMRPGVLALLNLNMSSDEKPLSPVELAARDVDRYMERYEHVEPKATMPPSQLHNHTISRKLKQDMRQFMQKETRLLPKQGVRGFAQLESETS